MCSDPIEIGFNPVRTPAYFLLFDVGVLVFVRACRTCPVSFFCLRLDGGFKAKVGGAGREGGGATSRTTLNIKGWCACYFLTYKQREVLAPPLFIVVP